MNNFDFNLLVVLNALLEDNSVNLAAKKLNVTAPAISKSLNKIRILFNDQILVRSGTKLIPTPKALSLKKNIKELVHNIESVFNTNIVFIPKITTISFTIASNNAIFLILDTILFQETKNQAPNVFIKLVNHTDYNDNFLRDHTIDLYIGETRPLNPEITIRTIYTSKCYLICRNNHSILSKNKNIDNLLTCQFIKTEHERLTNSDEHNKYFWEERRIISITPEYIITVHAIAHSDALAIIPEFMLKTIHKLNIPVTHFNATFNLGTRKIIQAWHSKLNQSPAHKWLREFTKNIFLNNIK